MPPLGFETTVSVDERPQTYALDLVATGTGQTINSTKGISQRTHKSQELRTYVINTSAKKKSLETIRTPRTSMESVRITHLWHST